MCGISGSVSLEQAFSLYQDNLSRGYQSSGFVAIGAKKFKPEQCVARTSQIFELDDLEANLAALEIDFKYFLFHSRAPTNTTQTEWDITTTHPFSYGNYLVAHNGIITNFKTFKAAETLNVDSKLIPYSLQDMQHVPYKEEMEVIKGVLEQMEGLLSCWILNKSNNCLYLVNAGSSIWVDDAKDPKVFSSLKFEGSVEPLSDGRITKIRVGTLETPSSITFQYNNPYFI